MDITFIYLHWCCDALFSYFVIGTLDDGDNDDDCQLCYYSALILYDEFH